MGSHAPADGIRIERKERKIPWSDRLLWVAAGIAMLAIGLYFWIDMHARSLTDSPTADVSGRQMSQGASIAVMPFKNLSGDPEQEYFSDGITDDIITDLSRFRNLLVIAGNTVFTYKGETVNNQFSR